MGAVALCTVRPVTIEYPRGGTRSRVSEYHDGVVASVSERQTYEGWRIEQPGWFRTFSADTSKPPVRIRNG